MASTLSGPPPLHVTFDASALDGRGRHVAYLQLGLR